MEINIIIFLEDIRLYKWEKNANAAKEQVGVSFVEVRERKDIVVMANHRKKAAHIVEDPEYVDGVEVKEMYKTEITNHLNWFDYIYGYAETQYVLSLLTE